MTGREVVLRISSANLFDAKRPEITASCSGGGSVASTGDSPTADSDEEGRFTWFPEGNLRLRLGRGQEMDTEAARA